MLVDLGCLLIGAGGTLVGVWLGVLTERRHWTTLTRARRHYDDPPRRGHFRL
jgi:hypothetical protein